MHIGPDELLVGAKIELDSKLTFDQVTSTIDTTERRIRERCPKVGIVYLEPDTYSPERSRR
jgi:divalent metal cation (Fe/Co/Zn/Cd) transporter